MSATATQYGDWLISFYAPPIPYRGADWQFSHKDYDGAEDAEDMRYGHAANKLAAMAEIDELCIDYDLQSDENERRWIKAAHEAQLKRDAA